MAASNGSNLIVFSWSKLFFLEQFQHVPSILQSLSIGTWLLWSFLFIESFWIDVSVKIYYLWLSSQTCDRYGQIMLTASDVSEYHAAWLQRGCVRPYAKSMPSGVPKMGVPRSSIWLYICVYLYILLFTMDYYCIYIYIYKAIVYYYWIGCPINHSFWGSPWFLMETSQFKALGSWTHKSIGEPEKNMNFKTGKLAI